MGETWGSVVKSTPVQPVAGLRGPAATGGLARLSPPSRPGGLAAGVNAGNKPVPQVQMAPFEPAPPRGRRRRSLAAEGQPGGELSSSGGAALSPSRGYPPACSSSPGRLRGHPRHGEPRGVPGFGRSPRCREPRGRGRGDGGDDTRCFLSLPALLPRHWPQPRPKAGGSPEGDPGPRGPGLGAETGRDSPEQSRLVPPRRRTAGRSGGAEDPRGRSQVGSGQRGPGRPGPSPRGRAVRPASAPAAPSRRTDGGHRGCLPPAGIP